jgi:SAM-dependent methyltransferase
MDEVKLGLARKAAVERAVSNVEFVARNVNDWDEPGAYDVVYARFLLQHLSEPVDLLRRMWAAVRSGGLVMVEDPDFDGWCCHPRNEGFDHPARPEARLEVSRLPYENRRPLDPQPCFPIPTTRKFSRSRRSRPCTGEQNKAVQSCRERW